MAIKPLPAFLQKHSLGGCSNRHAPAVTAEMPLAEWDIISLPSPKHLV